MKTNIVAPLGGVAILTGGIILALYTSTNAEALQNSKTKVIESYISQAKKALSTGDVKKAKKLIKEAIVVNPRSKKALKEFENIALLNCSKLKSIESQTSTSKSNTNKNKSVETATEEAEADDEMGCIYF